MRTVCFFAAFMALLASCGVDPTEVQLLRRRTDSLSLAVGQMKPGLGEYMLSVQMHHNKLWYAGKHANWELASFELGEIGEQLTHARQVNTDRPEIKSLPMLDPFLDSLAMVVKNKDSLGFRHHFTGLTNACNSCHKSVHFDFIRVKVPEQPMFTNQEW